LGTHGKNQCRNPGSINYYFAFAIVEQGDINSDPAQAAALTTLITFVIQYMVPERR
jgi:hypothetical protein